MKIHRFITPVSFTQDLATVTDPDLVHQMGRVLRLEVGELIVLCDGEGHEVEGPIVSIDKKSVVIQIHERRESATESMRRVTLYLAMLKRDNFELAVQKATEVGIAEIVPLITARTIKQQTNLERLQTIAREAAEQSGRGYVPKIHEPTTFKEAFKKVKDSVFFFDLNGSLFTPSSLSSRASEVSFFIGPEGGWTDEERSMANEQGLTIVGLGPRVLRGETAAIIASYLMCQES